MTSPYTRILVAASWFLTQGEMISTAFVRLCKKPAKSDVSSRYRFIIQKGVLAYFHDEYGQVPAQPHSSPALPMHLLKKARYQRTIAFAVLVFEPVVLPVRQGAPHRRRLPSHPPLSVEDMRQTAS